MSDPGDLARAASNAVDAYCAANPAPELPHWAADMSGFSPVADRVEITYCAQRDCPHADAQRVHTADGEHVGWLCPDCDAALPPAWLSYSERNRLLAESHDHDHHGAPFLCVLGCPRCGEEITGG